MPRIDDIQQEMQEAIDEVRDKFSEELAQFHADYDRVATDLRAHRAHQDQVAVELRNLITGLGVQMMQLNRRVNEEAINNGHKCATQVYALELVELEGSGSVSESLEESGDSTEVVEGDQSIEEVPQISLEALTGRNSVQTMRITGKIGNHALHILVDSGSTHNFLDLGTATHISGRVRRIPPLVVAIANGEQLECN